MNETASIPVFALLVESLPAWGVAGSVTREADGGLGVAAGGVQLRIARAPAGLPFRWTVTDGGRVRGATGIPGLLRIVRAAVDPDHRPVRVCIAPLPS